MFQSYFPNIHRHSPPQVFSWSFCQRMKQNRAKQLKTWPKVFAAADPLKMHRKQILLSKYWKKPPLNMKNIFILTKLQNPTSTAESSSLSHWQHWQLQMHTSEAWSLPIQMVHEYYKDNIQELKAVDFLKRSFFLYLVLKVWQLQLIQKHGL